MNLNITFYIFLTIYLSSITLEAFYSQFTKKGLYGFKDSLANIFFGLSGVLNRALTKGVWFAFWTFLFQYSLVKMSEALWSWVLLFFLNEFVSYWFHRISHENKYLWAIHVNHHSSEKLNFLTAARIPYFNLILHNLFWIPLLLVGFSPLMIFAIENFSFLFTFVLHTQIIRKIPYVDFIFNTPALHRVHHASNPEYINKNYGNVLIVFDRIFGTFKAEEDNIVIKFGITKNINTYNPIKIIFHEWIDLFRQRKHIKIYNREFLRKNALRLSRNIIKAGFKN